MDQKWQKAEFCNKYDGGVGVAVRYRVIFWLIVAREPLTSLEA